MLYETFRNSGSRRVTHHESLALSESDRFFLSNRTSHDVCVGYQAIVLTAAFAA